MDVCIYDLNRFRDTATWKNVACIIQPYFHASVRGIPSNFIARLNKRKAKVERYFTSKTAWFCLQPCGHNPYNTDNNAANWRSRSFKVIYFCSNQKPTTDFLLVINCHLCFISHRFRDITPRSRKLPLLWALRSRGTSSNFVIKLTVLKAETFRWVKTGLQ